LKNWQKWVTNGRDLLFGKTDHGLHGTKEDLKTENEKPFETEADWGNTWNYLPNKGKRNVKDK